MNTSEVRGEFSVNTAEFGAEQNESEWNLVRVRLGRMVPVDAVSKDSGDLEQVAHDPRHPVGA